MGILLAVVGLAILALVVYLVVIGLVALVTAIKEIRKGWKSGRNKKGGDHA